MEKPKPTNDAAEITEKYQHRLEFEHELINHRITWLLASQSLLFTAFALAPKQNSSYNFLRIIAIVGPVLAFFIAVTILASYLAKFNARKILTEKTRQSKVQVGVKTWITVMAGVAELALPIVFIVAWTYILNNMHDWLEEQLKLGLMGA